MKKVCIITTAHTLLDARIFYRECQSLAKKYEVILMAPGERDRLVSGVRVVGLPTLGGPLGRALRGHKVLRLALKEKADIYHFHDFDFLFWSGLLRLISRRPVIFDSHEFYSLAVVNREWTKGSILRPFLIALVSLYEKTFGNFPSKTIVANPLQQKIIKNSLAILNLPPLESYPDKPIKKNYKKIIYIGNVTKDRVSDKISKIREGLSKDYKITVAGRVVDVIGDPNIETVGFVPNDEIQKKFSDYGVGLVPFNDKKQYYASISSKIFDYMALGMVVIAPKFIKPSFGDMDISRNIIFVDGSPKSFADAITNLSEKRARQYSERNRKDFLNIYNWSKEEKKLFKAYKELLGE